MQFIKLLFTAYSQAITSFFYIAIVLVVYFEIQRNAQLEESWLGIIRNPVTTKLYYVILYGLLGGLVASSIILIFRIAIDYQVMLSIWSLSLFLSLFNQRYLCLSYSVGIISLVSLIFGWSKVNVPSLIVVVGILHLVESILILIDGTRDIIPVYIEHSRFTPAGAYIMSKMWPVPLVTLLTTGQITFPIVAVLIYEDEAITQIPLKRARESSFWIASYGLVILILAMISYRVRWMAYIAALATLFLHELLFILNRRGQRRGEPAFAAPWRGIRVLEALPESIGERMGIKRGDIILTVNGKQVNSEAMLGEILESFPSLIWMDVLRNDNETVELEYKDYGDGISDLGIILVPRTTGKFYLFDQHTGLLSRIWGKYISK
ncbi:MAG: PDZ domain-containing protein [Caldicoprobacterales bacterium]|jgi:hypothetical protein|nr:PDZ domain-containing protein [Clostridiales bacterium]